LNWPGRRSTTRATSPILFALLVFQVGSPFHAQAALDHYTVYASLIAGVTGAPPQAAIG
jgi:hypothetical protein